MFSGSQLCGPSSFEHVSGSRLLLRKDKLLVVIYFNGFWDFFLVEYVPGERNIGTGGRRMRELGAVLGFSGFLAVLLVYSESLLSLEGALSTFLLLYFGYYNFFQAEQSFCGTFGALGFHYGSEGLEKTSDEEKRSKDLKKSLRQNSAALGLTSLFTAWTFLLLAL